MDSHGKRLADGDSEAFAELYDSVADRVFHYLLTRTGSRDDAADLLQETFARLIAARDRLAAVDNLPAYVFRIARNEFLRWCESNRRTKAITEELFDVADNATRSELETREIVTKAMNCLDDNFLEVVELKLFSNLTFAEIAEVLGKPQGTVATWYRRALAEMRSQLNREIL